MEVMVVIAITITLMSIIGGGVLYTYRVARVDMTRLVLDQTAQDVIIHETRHRRPPEALAEVYPGQPLPEDAWGTPLGYERVASRWDLISLGEDGLEGGDGFDADLRYAEGRTP